MASFSTIAAGGIDYYQQSRPSGAKDGEIWLPFGGGDYDGSNANGLSQKWQHTVHTNEILGLHVADGVVYSGGSSFDIDVVAADADTGDILWQHGHHGSDITGIDVYEERVIAGGSGGGVSAANPTDGSLIWIDRAVSGGEILSLTASSGLVLTSDVDANVNTTIAVDGAESGSDDLHSEDINTIHSTDGFVYTGSDDQNVKKNRTVPGFGRNSIWFYSRDSGVNSLDESNGEIFVGTNDNFVTALDAGTGNQLMDHSHHSTTVNTVHAVNGAVFSGDANGNIIGADASNGSQLFSFSTSADTIYELHESNGLLYATSGNFDTLTFTVTAYQIDGIFPSNGGTIVPRLHFNGEWLELQN